MSLPENLIFYDGTCGVCDRFVAFVLRHDVERKFHFCPLNSEIARSVLPEGHGESSIAFLHFNELYVKSTAVALVLEELPGVASLGRILKLVPTGLRDIGYDLFARFRKVWGRPAACALLGPNEQIRFLTGQKLNKNTGRIK